MSSRARSSGPTGQSTPNPEYLYKYKYKKSYQVNQRLATATIITIDIVIQLAPISFITNLGLLCYCISQLIISKSKSLAIISECVI